MLAANRSRKRSHNPSSPRHAKRRRRSRVGYYTKGSMPYRRRRTHRNPAFKGILGELASMGGLILLGSAAIAPTTVNMIADKLIPAQYATGYTGLLGKAVIAGAAVWLLDDVVKQRKAAIGFAAGSLGTILAEGYKLVMVRRALPAAVTATPAQHGMADEIAKNPTLYRSLMEGQPYGNSLNGYEAAPMGAYDMAPAMNGFESLN
jgi:hypothetical protein